MPPQVNMIFDSVAFIGKTSDYVFSF